MTLLDALGKVMKTPYEAPMSTLAGIVRDLVGARRASIFGIQKETVATVGERDDGSAVIRLNPSAPEFRDVYKAAQKDGLTPFFDLLPGWWMSVVLQAGDEVRGAIVVEGFKHEPSDERLAELQQICAVIALRLAFAAEYQRILSRQQRDPLTRLPLRDAAEGHIKRLLAHGQNASIYMIDLNRFKECNDTYGHDHGDHVLQLIVRAMNTMIRADDTLARWGGDEFLLVAPGIPTQDIGKRISKALASVNLSEKLGPATGAIGRAVLFVDGVTVERLIKVADERMYENKLKMKLAAGMQTARA